MSRDKIIQQLIEQLELEAHPEGGWYKEVYRSSTNFGEPERSLLTSIYFLLSSENISKFHRIKSDEIWYFHTGSPLIVHTLDKMKGHTEHLLGLELEHGQKPQLLVPANTIFGSSVLEENSYSLVSCAVAPGFDFKDFELFDQNTLKRDFPEFEKIIEKLT